MFIEEKPFTFRVKAERMDAGVFEDEIVSMVDVLQEDNELEEEARAVLGDSDDQHCTYLVVSWA